MPRVFYCFIGTIIHTGATQNTFCIVRPLPTGDKLPLVEEHPEFDFEDPDTNENYKAIRLNATWYPLTQISRFVCQICAQMEPGDLTLEVKRKYKLKDSDRIGFYLFKLIEN